MHTQTCAMGLFVLGVGVGIKPPSHLKTHKDIRIFPPATHTEMFCF